MSTINETAALRIAEDKAEGIASGFTTGREFFALGTRLADSGKAKWEESRRDHLSRPLIGDAVDGLIEKVRAEARADVNVNANRLRLLPTGRLSTDEGLLSLEEPGFRGLAARVTPGGASYLSDCPPELRSFNANYWLGQCEPERELTLRTRRDDEGGRTTFAVVGPRYEAFDADEIAKLASEVIDPSARVQLAYDGYKLRIDALFHSPITAEEAGVGETFRAGVTIQSADDGSGSIRTSALIERVRCVNLTRLRGVQATGARKHIGRGIAEEVRTHVVAAQEKVAGFIARWKAIDTDVILDSGKDPREQFELLVTRGYVKPTGCRREEFVNRLVRAWEQEPARYTRTAVVNAITRAAHSNPWSSPWAAQAIEEQAGELVYVRNVLLN